MRGGVWPLQGAASAGEHPPGWLGPRPLWGAAAAALRLVPPGGAPTAALRVVPVRRLRVRGWAWARGGRGAWRRGGAAGADRSLPPSRSCDSGGDCECLCSAIATYADECARHGLHVRWRSQDLCRECAQAQRPRPGSPSVLPGGTCPRRTAREGLRQESPPRARGLQWGPLGAGSPAALAPQRLKPLSSPLSSAV